MQRYNIWQCHNIIHNVGTWITCKFDEAKDLYRELSKGKIADVLDRAISVMPALSIYIVSCPHRCRLPFYFNLEVVLVKLPTIVRPGRCGRRGPNRMTWFS